MICVTQYCNKTICLIQYKCSDEVWFMILFSLSKTKSVHICDLRAYG